VAEAGPSGGTCPEPAPHRRIHAGMAELVVRGALLRVAEHLVGLLGLLEALLGGLVAGVAVGVVLHRPSPVGLLYLGLAGVSGHSEDFVVIALRHSQQYASRGPPEPARSRRPRGRRLSLAPPKRRPGNLTCSRP